MVELFANCSLLAWLGSCCRTSKVGPIVVEKVQKTAL